MQYSYISIFKKAGLAIPFQTSIKVITLLIILSYLFFEIKTEEDLLRSMYLDIHFAFNHYPLIYSLIPLLLVPLNWSFEALKWQVLSEKIVHSTFVQALSGVLAGLSLGFVTPQVVGDYAGRILMIGHNRRTELVGAVFLGSIIQAAISIFFGVLAILYISEYLSPLLTKSMFFLYSALLIVVALVFFNSKTFINILPIRASIFIKKYLGIIRLYSTNELIKVSFFAIARYCIFAFQFVWTLILFGIDLPIEILFCGVSWVYAAKTIIPAFNFLSDLGVREFSALLFFEHFQAETSKIILASLFIWFINIFVPTLIGSFLVLRFKFNAK